MFERWEKNSLKNKEEKRKLLVDHYITITKKKSILVSTSFIWRKNTYLFCLIESLCDLIL
jgi:hypothetical protein